MASLAPKHQAASIENLQHTSHAGASPALYGNTEAGKRNKLATKWLGTGHFERSPQTALSRGGEISPILGPQDQFLPPPILTGPASISLPNVATKGINIWGFFALQWRKHKAPIYVFSAQFFGALMNLFARLLELGETDTKLHPMQLLLWRMLITTLGCSFYILRHRIPHGLLGSPDVRWLLVARGVSGFFGIYGVWYSIQYLPLAEATVITFLAPNLAGYLCHLFLKDPYTRTEQLASLLALGGVVLITKPMSLFSGEVQGDGPIKAAMEAVVNATAEVIAARGTEATGSTVVDPQMPTTSERLAAVGAALLGVLGTAFAFTTLRAIGPRAHTLLSVNYFGALCVVVSVFVLSVAPYVGQPDLGFVFPSSIYQWSLLLLITACGLILQVLITKGLAAERSNRATAMTYTQMLFAAGFDRLVWGTTISWTSATGCTMIIAGAVWVATAKKTTTVARSDRENRDIERDCSAGIGAGEDARLMPGRRRDGQDEGILLETIR
ncbi:putative integral membrane protein DUF6 [Rosellinia necatrix]|uniref:Putative integral membrane protein DUF6 n=1 Tax=Rosellinia necatrix TaxID=77044 RepID=A0A1W2TCJ8_ROSNE|nr:putative integral membrane protein DUF6 [Rosellinia necatrix]